MPTASACSRRSGSASVDDLFADIPASVRASAWDLPPPLTEQEVRAELARLAGRNRIPEVSFLGAGVYRHLIPAVVGEVIGRPEFATAYTPYQPEVSQGTLQSIYEFQSLICELTGMEVATRLALRRGDGYRRGRAHGLPPHPPLDHRGLAPASTPITGASSRPTAPGLGSRSSPSRSTWPRTAAARPTSPGPPRRSATDVACLVAAQPNFYGQVEPMAELADAAHAAGALLVAVVEPTSLAILQAPGDYGADLVAAEGQPLGIPAQLRRSVCRPDGGAAWHRCGRCPDGSSAPPATRRADKGYVLTLQAREQHIRREKAASNICTNQALMALAATAYLSAVGPTGLREVAELSMTQARHLATALEDAGARRAAVRRRRTSRRSRFACPTPLVATRRSSSTGSWPATCRSATTRQLRDTAPAGRHRAHDRRRHRPPRRRAGGDPMSVAEPPRGRRVRPRRRLLRRRPAARS